ncbi:MAG: class I SAM-dependent methyltransferase, partial [Candidatus Lokiarchaeota archaeon]|nr:class I SAM-dependent methyltransferase [Candidatus Lokiarchaeota archaeon]
MAFHSLPRMVKPSILDAGCGTGVCTLELARLTDGIVTGIDVDPAALAKLDLKIHRGGLAGRMITKR